MISAVYVCSTSAISLKICAESVILLTICAKITIVRLEICKEVNNIGLQALRWIDRTRPEFALYWKAAEQNEVAKELPSPTIRDIREAHRRIASDLRNDMILTRFDEFLSQTVEHKNVCFAFIDSEGFLLKLFGDQQMLSDLRQLEICVGSRWTLERIGPNAVSLGLMERSSFACTSDNNYCKSIEGYDIYFTPLLTASGKSKEVLIGGLALFVSAALGGVCWDVILMSAAYMMTLHLHHVTCHFRDVQLTGKVPLTIDTGIRAGTPIITTSNEDAYDQLFELIDLPPRDLYMKPARELFDPAPENRRFWEIINRLESVNDEEIVLSVQGKRMLCVLSSVAFDQPGINMRGLNLLLTTPQRVAMNVSSRMGNSAVRTFADIIGQSEPIQAVLRRAKRMAETDSNVILLGESGVGKDVFAQAIHNASKRRDKPFIAINCGALPRDLIASELFGYEGGAFTGAKRQGNIGKFELANGGTLFLDEIGELPLDLQATLLRAVEQKRITRVGGSKEIEVDVKIISATNADLLALAEQKLFRQDLYYRLSTLPLYIPPLRERGGDILLIARSFIENVSARIGRRDIMDITPEAQAIMLDYPWPGNVRELQNMIEGIVQLYPGPGISAEAVLETMRPHIREKIAPPSPAVSVLTTRQGKKADITREDIQQALVQCSGNRSEAARCLGVSRRTFYRYLAQFNIS